MMLSSSLRTFARVVIIAFSFTLARHAYPQVDAPLPPIPIKQVLIDMLHKPFAKAHVVQMINDQFGDIAKDHDAVIAAMVLARQHEESDLALAIADQALSNGITSYRLYYEIGAVFLVTGKCDEASILFNAVLSGLATLPEGESDHWMKEESRQALKLCQNPNIWVYGHHLSFGYESNLGNVAPMRKISPEEGSVLSRYLSALRRIIPDFPDEFTLGARPQKGYATSFHHYLNHNRIWDNVHYGINLGKDVKLTHPGGYDQIGVRLGLSRQTTGSRFVFTNQALIYAHKRNQGRDVKKINEEGIQLTNAIHMTADIIPSLSVTIGQHRSKQNIRQDRQSIDVLFRLQRRHASALIPWFVEAGRRQNTYDQPIHDTKSIHYGLGVEKFKINPEHAISARIGQHKSRPVMVRPWLNERYKTTTTQFSMTYHTLYSGRPFEVVFSWQNATSRNQIDNFEHFNLSIRVK